MGKSLPEGGEVASKPRVGDAHSRKMLPCVLKPLADEFVGRRGVVALLSSPISCFRALKWSSKVTFCKVCFSLAIRNVRAWFGRLVPLLFVVESSCRQAESCVVPQSGLPTEPITGDDARRTEVVVTRCIHTFEEAVAAWLCVDVWLLWNLLCGGCADPWCLPRADLRLLWGCVVVAAWLRCA